ncbi:hypothetical protein BBK82_04165 [Lentzea guizhouensis]|uniref:Uncharacterized protein n=1 Tax=Lentzea guizhouensis TaxID=1586287 RepID=A0A1B2HCE5_9PSEU|nr:hypothetical protein BBK82_04165 [Lentzea guizhouensis]
MSFSFSHNSSVRKRRKISGTSVVPQTCEPTCAYSSRSRAIRSSPSWCSSAGVYEVVVQSPTSLT